ncbi:unnamed protein product, partial [Allacma fusca]
RFAELDTWCSSSETDICGQVSLLKL